MLPGAHILMHFALCSSMQRASQNALLPIRVLLINRLRKPDFDQTFTPQRGSSDQVTVEFDAPRGTFAMVAASDKYRCAARDWVFIDLQHNRNIDEKLVDGVPPVPQPVLVVGEAPESFLYLKPQLVFFDQRTQCNQPVGDVLEAKTISEYDTDGYYSQLYATPDLVAHAPLVAAFQVPTSTGENHYIRLRIPFPSRWSGWPIEYQFNLSDDAIDSLTGQPTDTLLCPKIYETSAS